MQDLAIHKIIGAGALKPARLTDVPSWHGHIPFAFWCIETLRPKTFVELGTHKGDSYCAFCQAVSEFKTQTNCYAVDTWHGDKHSDYYGKSIFEELSRYHDALYGNFSQLVRSTFDEAAKNFSAGSIDLLHIDGLHTYEAVKHDFENWKDKMSDRGVVLLHDIAVREKDFGVWKFWAELKKRYPHFEFVHGHGLGVVCVGKQVPNPLVELCALPDQEANEIRFIFANLGLAVLCASDKLSMHAQLVEALASSDKRRQFLENSERQCKELVQKFSQNNKLLALERNRTAELSALHNEARQDNNALRKELIYMRRSFSWKITRPARLIMRLVNNLR